MEQRFDSYEDRFPFESDFLDGVEPKFQIERLSPDADSSYRVNADLDGFRRFIKVIDKFPIVEINLNILGIDSEIHFGELVCIDKIERLNLFRPVEIGPPISPSWFDGVADFTKLKSLQVNLVPLPGGLSAWARRLLMLSGDWLSMRQVVPFCAGDKLKKLDVSNYVGDLDALGVALDLTSLTFREGKITSLAGISESFPNLEDLTITGRMRPLDVMPIQSLRKLRYLRLDGVSDALNIGKIKLSELQMAYLGAVNDSDFFENNPQLTWFRAKKFTGKPTESMIARGWKKVGREFGTGDGFIPERMRALYLSSL